MAKKTDKIKSWDEASSMMQRQAQLKANADYITALGRDLRAQIDECETALNDFINAHRADLGPNRLKTLEGGQVSIRPSSTTRTPDEEATLDYVQRHSLDSCFKVSVKLIASGLKALDPETQAAAGVEIVTEDKVSIKLVSKSPNMKIEY